MRPKYGKLLSQERWNPQQPLFYQEQVRVDEPVREDLTKYLAKGKSERLKNQDLQERAGLGWKALRSLASGKTYWTPKDSYDGLVSVLGLDPEVNPNRIRVVGTYAGMPAAYYFDHNDIAMGDAIEILRPQLAKADAKIAEMLHKGSKESRRHAYNIINIRLNHLLTGRVGLLPITIVESYEKEVIKILGVEGITREQLIETFPGDIRTLEQRVDALVNDVKVQHPEKYGIRVSVNGHSITVKYQELIPQINPFINPFDPSEKEGTIMMRTLTPDNWEKKFEISIQKLKGGEPLGSLASYLPSQTVFILGNDEGLPIVVNVPQNVKDLDGVVDITRLWLERKTSNNN